MFDAFVARGGNFIDTANLYTKGTSERIVDELVAHGRDRFISGAPAWRVAQMNTIADFRGWTRFAALQIEDSLLQRTPERDLLPMAASLDLAVTPWGAKPRSYPSSARAPPPSSPTTSARSTSSSPRSTSPVWTPRAAWSWASPRNCSRSIGSATASRSTSGAASTGNEVRSAGSYRSDIRGCPSSRRTAGGSPRPSRTHRWASPA